MQPLESIHSWTKGTQGTLPYPTLPYPIPLTLLLSYHNLLNPSLPYPTLLYPTLPTLPISTYPYPTLPYPTLPYPTPFHLPLLLPYPTLLLPTQPCPTLPYPTYPFQLTLPYPTLPQPLSLPYSTLPAHNQVSRSRAMMPCDSSYLHSMPQLTQHFSKYKFSKTV